jgi:FkbM family methyltransferase
MLPKHLAIFATRYRQLGLCRALGLTLLKGLRKVLLPGVQFHFGMTAEDIVLRFLVEKYLGRKALTYVDVGCHEPTRISNSYLLYLEGARGLAVDLNPKFGDQFKRARPNDTFVCAAVSDGTHEAMVHEFSATEVNTIDAVQSNIWLTQFQPAGSRLTQTTSLSNLLERHIPNVNIDILLLDVEGHELHVLRGAQLSQTRPSIIVCELHGLELPNALGHTTVQFLRREGYALVAYATVNGYFVRADLVDGTR